MVRVLLFLCLVCVSVPSAADAQDAAAPASTESQTDKWKKLFQSVQGRLEIDGDHWHIEGADLPLPGQTGYRLYADVLDVYFDRDQLIANSNIAFTTPEGFIFADRLDYNIADGTAKFQGASGMMSLPDANRAEFGNQDPDVVFWGDEIEKRGPKKYVVTRGGFTTCVQPTPRWEVSGQSITINLDDYALARSTILRVKGVPLLYLPALYYPLHEEQRSTGFLMPSYGRSTLGGAKISNAFFWAIGRSQDATVFHDWFTRTGTGEGAEYRYVNGSGSGEMRLYRLNQHETVYDTGTLPNRTSHQINAALNQNLPFRLRGQGRVEYFTDVTTSQLYHQNAYQRTTSSRTISGGVTGIYGPTTVGGYFSRSEQFTDVSNSFVYGSTPRLTANFAPTRIFGSPAYLSLNSEYIFQPNRRLQDGIVTADESMARFDVTPTLRVPLSRLTYLSVTTNAAYHHTYFSRSLDESRNSVEEPVTRRYLSLQTDIVGPVLSKIWDTPGSGFSDRMKHVIEPTFSIEYLTDIADQARVPTTDSSAFAVGGAMKVTYGVTNRLFARTPATGSARGSTREFVTIGVQQTYYTPPETSRFDTTDVSYSGRPQPVDLSPVAVTARVSPTSIFDATAKLEYDVTGNGLQVVTAGSTINAGTGSANLNFSRVRFTPASDVSSYLSGSSSWRFAQGRMTAFYGLNWDIGRRYISGQSLGGTYLAQCCGVQADFQVVNFASSVAPIPSDRRLNFAFVLAGLGTFSNFFGLLGGQP